LFSNFIALVHNLNEDKQQLIYAAALELVWTVNWFATVTLNVVSNLINTQFIFSLRHY